MKKKNNIPDADCKLWKVVFSSLFLKQVFMGVVSTLLDTGKDQVKAKNKTKEKEVI